MTDPQCRDGRVVERRVEYFVEAPPFREGRPWVRYATVFVTEDAAVADAKATAAERGLPARVVRRKVLDIIVREVRP